MQVLTRQGSVLDVRLTATRQIRGGHPEPIVEFRFSGGILCADYYLSTFQEIEAGAGLCLQGGSFPQELEPDTVQACQAWLREAQP